MGSSQQSRSAAQVVSQPLAQQNALTQQNAYATMPVPSAMRVRRCGQFLDIPIRKGEAARFLGVHRNTVTKWDYFARHHIDNYRMHFEQSGSKEQAPLSPYRFWVLTRLKELYRIYRDESLIEKYVKVHPYDFSYRTFFELRKQEKQAS